MDVMDFKPKLSEHQEQSTFFDVVMFEYLRDYPELHPLLFSVPNGANLAGGHRQKSIQMARLKKEGFTPGVADVLFLSGRGGYLGLALEFKTIDRKTTKGGGVSESQSEFIMSARREGYFAEVVYGADDAIHLFERYLAMPKTQDIVWRALKEAENKQDVGEVINALKEVVLKW